MKKKSLHIVINLTRMLLCHIHMGIVLGQAITLVVLLLILTRHKMVGDDSKLRPNSRFRYNLAS